MDVGVVQSAGSLWHKEKDSADQYCDRHRLLCLDQYSIYSKYMGWEDLGRTLDAGKEEEAKDLGASIK